MELIRILKFVAGAVAKKDFLPAMTHFVIEDGFIRSFNGTLALCSPIPFEINCKPKAVTLVKAIERCNETASITMTAGGKLSIKSGTFRALVECVEESPLHVQPEGEVLQIDGQTILDSFRQLEEFIGEDASRPWATGILLKGQSAYATCNVILVERWMGVPFPITVVIPLSAVREVLRVGEAPTHAQYTDKSFTFHYSDGRWIRTQLLDKEAWPDIETIFAKVGQGNCMPMDERLFDALTYVNPFTDKEGRVYFTPGYVSTHLDEAETGAKIDIDGFNASGIYAIDMLKRLKGVVTHIDWSPYPAPCPFYGKMLRGMIIGRRA